VTSTNFRAALQPTCPSNRSRAFGTPLSIVSYSLVFVRQGHIVHRRPCTRPIRVRLTLTFDNGLASSPDSMSDGELIEISDGVSWYFFPSGACSAQQRLRPVGSRRCAHEDNRTSRHVPVPLVKTSGRPHTSRGERGPGWPGREAHPRAFPDWATTVRDRVSRGQPRLPAFEIRRNTRPPRPHFPSIRRPLDFPTLCVHRVAIAIEGRSSAAQLAPRFWPAQPSSSIAIGPARPLRRWRRLRSARHPLVAP